MSMVLVVGTPCRRRSGVRLGKDFGDSEEYSTSKALAMRCLARPAAPSRLEQNPTAHGVHTEVARMMRGASSRHEHAHPIPLINAVQLA
jgi:hypothetical protein